MSEPEITVRKVSMWMPYSDEQLAGSRALADAWHEAMLHPERMPKHLPRDTPVDKPDLYQRLLAAADLPVLRELVELHAPVPFLVHEDLSVPFWQCQGCDQGSHAEDDPDWPCRTVGALIHHLLEPSEDRS